MTGPRRVHLLGAGGHAKVVLQTLRTMGHTVAMIFDDDAAHWGKTLLGVSVAGPIERVEEHAALPAVIAIGDNARRKAVASRLNLEWMTVVHPGAYVDATVRLGAGTVILAGAVIQPDTVVGDHVIVNTSASVDHDCAIGDLHPRCPRHAAGGGGDGRRGGAAGHRRRRHSGDPNRRLDDRRRGGRRGARFARRRRGNGRAGRSRQA